MTEAAARSTTVDRAEQPPRSQWYDVWDQFKSHKGALVGAAVFLSSDASAFVNGHVLYVDGGVTASL